MSDRITRKRLNEPEQIRLLPGLDPDDLIAQAKERWKPIKTFAMFSGGNDSMVLAHRCREHYDALFFIDTGTGIDEGDGDLRVIDHVRESAEWLGKPLTIISAGDAFEDMVLGGRILSRGENEGQPEPPTGFPGPGMHGKAYTRLKERQIEELVKQTKVGKHRNDAVLLLSGVRRDESKARASYNPLTEHGSAKYCNPLIDWSNAEMRRYRAEHELPQSEISARIHMSGECICGAKSGEGERLELELFFPKTFARIRRLEQRCEDRGIRWCRYGGYDLNGVRSVQRSVESSGPACEMCDQRAFSLEAA